MLGFPCNQFANQEPGSDEEASEYCQVNYGVEFPVFAKVNVNGPNAHPLFAWLRNESDANGADIEWNFAKFVVGRDGQLVERFAPPIDPLDLVPTIEAALSAKQVRRSAK